MNARDVWIRVVDYRGCELCVHRGGMVDGVRRCMCPDLVDLRLQPGGRPVDTLRTSEGNCGPEARFMDFPGLRT